MTKTDTSGLWNTVAPPQFIEEGREFSRLHRRKIGAKPLYRQVIDQLKACISEGEWIPELPIQSKFELAAQMGVSQGTVRKALDEMTREGLLVRHQGKGTFVVGYDDDRILFDFFKLTPDSKARIFPSSVVISVGVEEADAQITAMLNLAERARVVRIKRVRSLFQRPAIIETVWVSAERFPDLATRQIRNNLYNLYATQYGRRVVHAREEIKAVLLPAADANLLGVPPESPVLQVGRIAFEVDVTPVEHRVSLCVTDDTHYRLVLR
jgi:GntR family transcriptional regulator